MSLVSIRLPEAVEAQLIREAARTRRPKSEIARDAIIDYLERTQRERFLDAIARAAGDRGHAEALAAAEEALSIDNEALALGEAAQVQEPDAPSRVHASKKKRRR